MSLVGTSKSQVMMTASGSFIDCSQLEYGLYLLSNVPMDARDVALSINDIVRQFVIREASFLSFDVTLSRQAIHVLFLDKAFVSRYSFRLPSRRNA